MLACNCRQNADRAPPPLRRIWLAFTPQTAHHFETITHGKGDAFDYRPRQMGPSMPHRQADPPTACLWVAVRMTFAGEVRGEEQAFATGGDRFHFTHEQFVGIYTLLLRLRNQVTTELVTEPLQRAACREHYAHLMPRPGHGMTECVHLALGMRLRLHGMTEEHTAGSHGSTEDAGHHDAITHRASRLVACPANHGDADGQTQLSGGTGIELPGHLMRFHAAWHQPGIEPQLTHQPRVPTAFHHIEQQRSRSIAHFAGQLARELQTQVILGQQHVLELGEVLRLMVTQPENLGGGEAGEGGVAHHLDKCRPAPRCCFDGLALLLGSLIVPQ